MKKSETLTCYLPLVADSRSISRLVAVPEWASTARVYPRVSKWDNSMVELVHGAGWAIDLLGSFDPPVLMIDNTPSPAVDVRGVEMIAVKTQNAGAGAGDQDAAFVVVFGG